MDKEACDDFDKFPYLQNDLTKDIKVPLYYIAGWITTEFMAIAKTSH